MITEHYKAAHCRSDYQFLFKAHAIHSPSWCSRCCPNDGSEKRAWRRRIVL